MIRQPSQHSKIDQLDAILVTDKSNLFYLTGFRGSKGFLILTKKNSTFYTDGRYIEYAKKTIPPFIKTKLNPTKGLELSSLNSSRKTIGFDGKFMTVNELEKYKKIIRNASFVNISEDIKQLRAVKDKTELLLMRKSQKITEKIFLSIKKIIQQNQDQNRKQTSPIREIDLVWKIKSLAFEFGAEDLSFDPIVSFGKNTSMPHHLPDKTTFKKGDIVMIDMGVKYKGYCSDMTRMIFTKKPTEEQKKIFNIVKKAQEASFKKAKHGVTAQELDSAARDFIKEEGYGEFFQHGTGHGIGIDIHEFPSLSAQPSGSNQTKANTQNKIEAGTVITIEPGIYLPGKFGIRLENMVLIKKTGAESITKISNSL